VFVYAVTGKIPADAMSQSNPLVPLVTSSEWFSGATSGSSGVIASPNYPMDYAPYVSERIDITGPEGTYIVMQVNCLPACLTA
jgi:hypothetical protein